MKMNNSNYDMLDKEAIEFYNNLKIKKPEFDELIKKYGNTKDIERASKMKFLEKLSKGCYFNTFSKVWRRYWRFYVWINK